MAFSWGGNKKSDEAAKKAAEAKRKGEKNWKAPDEAEKKAAAKVRANHQTYLTAAGGAAVAYVNCYCNHDGDHSRGTYDPK